MTRRITCKVDRNQPEIVGALRDVGAKVVDLSKVGNGCMDLLAAFRAQLFALEIKDGEQPPCERQLTPAQVKFHAEMAAVGITVHVVLTVDDALRAIGATS